MKEEEYKKTLLHIIMWLGGENEWDMMKPVNAEFANGIREVCILVAVQGKTLEEACSLVKTN